MTETTKDTSKEAGANIGRNEPCPCGSGKKYKRCCGVDAAPKLTAPRASSFAPGMGPPSVPAAGGMPPATGAGGFGPEMLNQMDPQMMMQLSQALQRLPRGQMQRLQALVQKAMSGKDVTRESAEFEKTLPVELQEMLRGFTTQAAGLASMAGGGADVADAGTASSSDVEGAADMSAEEARALVAKAAAEGKISKEQADQLLSGTASETIEAEATPVEGDASRFSGFFKGLRKKK